MMTDDFEYVKNIVALYHFFFFYHYYFIRKTNLSSLSFFLPLRQ